MKLTSLPLAILLVLSAVIWAVGQSPPAERSGDRPPPRESREMFDGPDGERRERGWHGRGRMMDEAQIREALQVLRMIDPEKAERLEAALEENPEQVARVLHENFPNLGRFMAWKRYDPEGFDLRIQDLKLSRQTHACAKRLRDALDAGDDEGAALEQIQLEQLVSDHFDIRQQARERELAKLQERIADLAGELEERSNNREELIAQRIEELLDEDREDRW